MSAQTGGAKCRWGMLKSTIFDQCLAIYCKTEQHMDC